MHVNDRRLDAYLGNYSAFEAQRAARLAEQQASYEKQQRAVAHLEAFVARFRAKATKARQAQSRIHALERLERIAAAHVDAPFCFRFRAPAEMPRHLFRLEDAAVGHEAPRCSPASNGACIPATRSACSGPTGPGKSTLLKSIAGELPLVAGSIHRAQGLRVGYLAQHQVDQLRLDDSALAHIARLAPGEREQSLRDYLGGFDFRRRPGDAARGKLLRRGEGAPGAGAHRMAAAEPAAPRRAHQPPRHRDARSARRGAGGFRGRAGDRGPRPAPARRGHRPVDARGRRRHRRVRRHARRVSRLGAALPRARRAQRGEGGGVRRAR